MSFIRPKVAAAALRWRETTLWAALTLAGLFWLYGPGAVRAALMLLWGMVGLWLTRSALLSALAAARAEAPGVVSIDERRISYFGPYAGGVLALDEIGRIAIGAEEGGAVWRLWSPESAAPLTIPAAAEGAGGLIDAFAALPGFAPTRALSTLHGAHGELTIWRREPAPTFTALAHGDAAD
ncbi:hypothetical protein G5B40_10830 [Pikeienuella piscinae]|uniref:Uncharacterized protein n=1 Tax=Pikeienuella piscinae TaxID=2748098 RepID=A0A7L5C213_9RHOB|nr:hypothetical protein [Pikeienuella piscinae]QIE55899.1 hypothetical protein G5B40_10830 [Pikeienuella piscinae]